jgi:hypothetical protein
MTVGRFTTHCTQIAIGVLMLAGVPALASAQDDHAHGPAASQPMTPDQQTKAGALVSVVRDATERFKDSAVAENEGYGLQFGCVSGSDYGAMGMHFVNFPLVFDGELDPAHPEIVLYEPLPSGKLRITGADYLVLADAWHAKHAEQPQLMGQLFHFFDSPNRFGLPPFYTLHVWAWKDNPSGAFTNWNPNVSCEAFAGQDR